MNRTGLRACERVEKVFETLVGGMERWLNEAKEGRHDGQMSATVVRNARCSLVAGIEAIESVQE